ncbi:retropepsin-like aspartic protease family protein [Pseudomonas typographi]|uniref:TIGR02281 family clan AA aspartic protease n=1 Tax=Pseudomonas typographi TaxID=2715964 RepID=A0ABR7YVT7_9PSED|nr:TIGR02281 family clan AA aspartic protease [Pseudomonas typographi]MBD1549841.1 TIGR02281 family clan AA aspartic protease [Pseudomonas typographi]MBD1585222.1 TIGR02281 family clan AA aspartic protease [Pseudomonas typographi]MBD1597269.1 TIGR02281 family clan AA aspartic protease [Pseudomonas typographi]
MTAAPPGRRAGRLLLVIAWGAGLFLATRFFGQWERHQENPNPVVASTHGQGYVQVSLQANRQGHFVASGRIDGRPVMLMLDTGATEVAVPEGVARELGLAKGLPVVLSTANGRVEGFRSRLRELQVGDIHLAGVSAVVIPGLGDDTVLLGMSALKRLEFTQRGGTLLLRQNLNQ